MMNYKKIHMLALLLVTLLSSACKKQWDDRTAVTDQQLDKNVFQQIQGNSNLSTFTGYLTKLGYDKLLASSKTYTVWAPNNQALQGVDPAMVADTAKLRLFVNNHIANQVFLTTAPKPSLRVRTLNGKNVTFTAVTVEEATITAGNQYVRNGVVHVINQPLTPKLNIYDYIKSLTTVGGLHKAYLQRQDSTFVDTTLAKVDRIDPATGKPILVAGTGVVTRNLYFTRVANLAAEDSLYTYFVLTDDAYNAERNKVSRFFTTVTNSTDTTMNFLAAFNVLKDVAVRGVIKPENLPASLLSINGVPMPINKAAIVQTYNASNGIVYVINSMDFKLEDKIKPIIIEGEKPSFFTRTDKGGSIAFRLRLDPTTNLPYRDIFIGQADLPANFFAAYKLSNLYTCRYRVVWRAINDLGFTVAPLDIQQKVSFSQLSGAVPDASGNIVATPVVSYPYYRTGVLKYDEFELTNPTATAAPATIGVVSGAFNVAKYSSINMYVQGDNFVGASTNVNRNAVIIDYIKLIPILQ